MIEKPTKIDIVHTNKGWYVRLYFRGRQMPNVISYTYKTKKVLLEKELSKYFGERYPTLSPTIDLRGNY